MLRYLFVPFLFVLSEMPFDAQNIYFIDSSGGKDSNSGRSESAAWKSIAKLNSHLRVAKPGDVFRFRRGRIYEGQVNVPKGGTETSPVIFDAYGTGYEPMISGSIYVTGWKRYSRDIYSASVKSQVKNVFAGKRQLILARTPNAGTYFRMDESGLKNVITDSGITKPVNYWKGANCRIRTSDFTWETASVVSSSGNRINLGAGISYNLRKNFIYYLDNLFPFLDAPDEWYAANNLVYVYLKQPKDTADLGLTIYDHGMNVSANNVVIRNLNFTGQAVTGIYLSNGTNIIIEKNSVSNCLHTGVDIKNSSGIHLTGNTITGCNGIGISGSGLSNSFISGNKVTDIGLIPGYGQSGYNGEIGIFVNHEGNGNTISRNHVERTGYTGIRSDSPNTVIEMNIVKQPLQVLKDGGGIYIWGPNSNHCTIRKNYVENYSSKKEKYPAYHNWTNGIYLDDRSWGNKVSGNIVDDSGGPGIFLHNSHDNMVEGNTVYGTSLTVTFDIKSEGSTYTNTIRDNTIFVGSRSGFALNLYSNQPTDFGTFDRNTYFNPYTSEVILCNSPNLGNTSGDLMYWQSLTGQDKNSSESYFKWKPFIVSKTTGSNLIENGTFDRDLDSWSRYRENFVSEWKGNSRLDGGYADIYFISDNPSYGAFFTKGEIDYRKNRIYQLKFDSASDGFFSLIIRDSDNPVSFNEKLTIGGKRKNYTFVFRAEKDLVGKVDFATVRYTKSHLYLDNVSLYEVVAKPNTPFRSILFRNLSGVRNGYDAGQGRYKNLKGEPVNGRVMLDPWEAMVLVRK